MHVLGQKFQILCKCCFKISYTWIIFLTNLFPFSTTRLKSSITEPICMLKFRQHKYQKWSKTVRYVLCHKSTKFHSICKLKNEVSISNIFKSNYVSSCSENNWNSAVLTSESPNQKFDEILKRRRTQFVR